MVGFFVAKKLENVSSFFVKKIVMLNFDSRGLEF